jgi:hypothetical protein
MENLNTNKTTEKESQITNNKKIELTADELLNLLKTAYKTGYATYEMVEAGLEPYDPDSYARWVLLRKDQEYQRALAVG